MELLKVSEINKCVEDRFELKNINFTQKKGCKIAIAGETGSGKSTLLKIIAGIETPDRGEVIFEQERVKKVPAEKLIPGHPGIAYLSQQFELPHSLTVEQVLIYANTLSDEEAKNDSYAKGIYDMCRITHLLKRRTSQLSGGEKQRIAMARVLVSSPRLLLLDEPFSNLDIMHKNVLKSIIIDISEKLNITCTLISHDPLDTLSWADEIFVLKAGEIIQRGSPTDIYKYPVNEYVAGLFGKYYLLNDIKKGELEAGIDPLFLRPEDFRITAENASTIKGIINKVLFFGSYYEIEVQLPESNITIKVNSCTVNIGDTVHVALNLS